MKGKEFGTENKRCKTTEEHSNLFPWHIRLKRCRITV